MRIDESCVFVVIVAPMHTIMPFTDSSVRAHRTITSIALFRDLLNFKRTRHAQLYIIHIHCEVYNTHTNTHALSLSLNGNNPMLNELRTAAFRSQINTYEHWTATNRARVRAFSFSSGKCTAENICHHQHEVFVPFWNNSTERLGVSICIKSVLTLKFSSQSVCCNA